jgi:hypothetical protein
MALKRVLNLDSNVEAITLGGFNKKTKKDNPKEAKGYYVGSKELPPSKFSKAGRADYLHYLQTPKGLQPVFGKYDLDKQLLPITKGTYVELTFTGMKPTPVGEKKTFSVDFDDENTIEVDNTMSKDTYSDSSYDEDTTSEDEEETEEEEQETPAPIMAAAAAERKAKVQALLGKKGMK